MAEWINQERNKYGNRGEVQKEKRRGVTAKAEAKAKETRTKRKGESPASRPVKGEGAGSCGMGGWMGKSPVSSVKVKVKSDKR